LAIRDSKAPIWETGQFHRFPPDFADLDEIAALCAAREMSAKAYLDEL
jgi:hypothetical protein